MPAGAADPSSNGRAPYEGERSVGQLFAAATADLSALVHDEIALAKAEIRKDVKRGLTGGVSIGVAAVVFLFSIPMLSAAVAFGIHALGLSLGWSFLIVAAAYWVLGVLLFVVARRAFKKIEPPHRAIEGAQKTAEVLKNARPRPATQEEIDRGLGRIP
ncbi:phage holin family protein [Kitasatospora cathayae]|uniref:Phage holin family protein n=1 Tax=Kitasatospora cathayae TaxID=3004092 RepID=A0ABY7Q5R3_9ACTN|nr:phage holin family protein [Kitasatospora sp. HUAS 3-15]WBP88066.1 phage holin family protein [Kitasatospora sp. HUAS 3-15]